MSTLRISPNLFLGKQELVQLQSFLDEESFRELLRRGSGSYGIIDSPKDASFTNFKVSPGATASTIVVNPSSRAINNLGQFITYEQSYVDEITIPLQNQYYWVMIEYRASAVEQGTVSIDTAGNLTGVGTKFTETLRGLPNFPSKVKFYDNSFNTAEYVVADVIDDTNAVLQGSFTAETSFAYSVWGTFTPGHIPVSGVDAEPFQRDNVRISLIQESTASIDPATGRPVKTEGLQFFIARVQSVGGVVEVQDKRTIELWRDNAEFRSLYLPPTQNALIGIESAKYDNTYTPKDKNRVTLAWGFRSDNWTINPTNNLLTFSSGEGGKFKSTTDFTTGDFDGWRVYINEASTNIQEYYIVESSVKVGTNINLTVRGLDVATFTPGTEIVVAPDAEMIELAFHPTANTEVDEQLRKYVEYPIQSATGKVLLTVPVNTGTYSYYVEYRYRNNQTYSRWFDFPNDTTNGYYDETSFESNGELKANPVDRNRKTYSITPNVGWLQLIPHPSSYANVLDRIDLGDLLGVEYQNTDNGNPVISLQVGQQRQVQIINWTNTFTTDHFINLTSTDAVNGNKFFLIFRGNYDRGSFNQFINEDFINPGSPGTNKYTFDAIDDTRATSNDLMFRCDFDGTDWQVQLLTSGKQTRWYSVGDLGTAYHNPNTTDGIVTSGSTLRWRLDENDNVQLQGRIELFNDLIPDTGISTSVRDIFTLPVGFRPTVTFGNAQHVAVSYDSNTNTGLVNPNFNGATLRIYDDGRVQILQARHFIKRIYVNAQFPIT